MIEREQATKLYDVYQRAFAVLCEAYQVLGELPDGPERDDAVRAHGETTDAVLFGLRARLLDHYPELEAAAPEAKAAVKRDPLNGVADAPLTIGPDQLERLSTYRSGAKLSHLPGVDPAGERERLSQLLNGLVDTLIAGLMSHPSKLWVMAQFQRVLVQVEHEDTEGREHFGAELESIMDILDIESSDGLLTFYLGSI